MSYFRRKWRNPTAKSVMARPGRSFSHAKAATNETPSEQVSIGSCLRFSMSSRWVPSSQIDLTNEVARVRDSPRNQR